MKSRMIFIVLALAACLGSCKYDDTDIWNRLEEQEARIAALEEWDEQQPDGAPNID